MQRERIGDLCKGRWESILSSLGVAPQFLENKHKPCPICNAGKDRFRFDNKEGRGTWFCSHCGSGDGFGLIQKLNGWTFPQAAREVERVLGVSSQDSQKTEFDDGKRRRLLTQTWKKASRLTKGDLAWQYLKGRTGLEELPKSLRLHPALRYDNENVWPAMLGIVSMADGTPSTLHRTWLDGKGGKAPVEQPKKVMSGAIKGGAIRLASIAPTLGIAEGIETAIGASVLFGMPVWAAISANGIQQWEVPEGVRSVVIFSDNDENFVGQNAAYSLAHRLASKGMQVEVRIPAKVGTDWADVAKEEIEGRQ